METPRAAIPPPEEADRFRRILLNRRTVHAFDPSRSVADETLDRALAAAVHAPNFRLTEPWRFRLLGPETSRAVAELNASLIERRRGADAARAKLERWLSVPGWMLLSCVRSDDPQRQAEDYAACACAAQNFQLALWSEGVGAKWTTGDVTRHESFFRLVSLDPDRELVVGLFWYGYPAALPPTPERKPHAEFVSRLP